MHNELTKEVQAAVTAEYERAARKYGQANNSPHESYAVILEEFEEAQAEERAFEIIKREYWYGVKANAPQTQLQQMQKIAEKAAAEWIQVAAMCYKAQIQDCTSKDERQICGTCKHLFADDAWVCINGKSDYCSERTSYDHSCAKWEPRADTREDNDE